MNSTRPTTYIIDGRTFVTIAGTAVEVIGGVLAAAAAAPEVAAALAAGAGVATIGAVGAAALPVKELSREKATTLGAQERAKFDGVAAMHAAGIEASPFQNQGYIDTLPTAAQLQAHAPDPRAMTPPGFVHEPTASHGSHTAYPQYVAPIDTLRLPEPAKPGMPGPHTTPANSPEAKPFTTPDINRIPGLGLPDTTALEQRKYDYKPAADSQEGSQALKRFNDCYPRDRDITGNSDNAFRMVKRDLGNPGRPGDQGDHIVTQAQTERFGTEVIQHEANIIFHSESTHTARTAIGNRLVREGSSEQEAGYRLVRDATGAQSFEDQFRIGLNEIRAGLDKRNVSPAEREYVEAQIKDREQKMPDLCKPSHSAPELENAKPTLDNVNNAVNAHNETHSRPLPNARSVSEWDGRTRVGSFVDLGGGMVAQHQGRGDYVVVDVARDLGGQQPPIGQFATLQNNGQVQVAQNVQSLGLGRG